MTTSINMPHEVSYAVTDTDRLPRRVNRGGASPVHGPRYASLRASARTSSSLGEEAMLSRASMPLMVTMPWSSHLQ